MEEEFNFKGSVMSLGSDCSIADMLSYIGVRESGALDWVDNQSGLGLVADVFSGALTQALKTRAFDWVTRIVTNKEGKECVDCCAHYHGADFIHDDFRDPIQVSDQIYMNDKTIAFAKQGGFFVYFQNDDDNYKDYLPLVERWFEENELSFKEQVLVLKPYFFTQFNRLGKRSYFQLSVEERIKACEELENRMKSHFHLFELKKREDFVPNKMVGLK